MNNPLEVHSIRLFLNFKDLDLGFGLVEITEPIGFDASNFVCLKDTGRYGRDVEYGNVDVELMFIDVATEPTTNVVTLPNGVIVDRLTMGLPFLLEADRLKGFEAEIEFIVEIDGETFTVGVIDCQDRETDGTTYYQAKIIQSTEKAELKRRESIKVDLFSNEDLDGNNVDPIETHNVLLKALPIKQISYWENDQEYTFKDLDNPPNTQAYFNGGTVLKQFDIQDSYSLFAPKIQSSSASEINDNFKVLLAQTTLTDVKIEIEVDITFTMTQGPIQGQGRIWIPVFVTDNLSDTNPESYDLYFKNWTSEDPGFVVNLKETLSVTIPIITPGKYVIIFCNLLGNADSDVEAVVRTWKQRITANSTHYDSVIKACRHIDLMKKTAEKVGGYNLIAERYDVNGPFYNNFVANGYMMRQFLEKGDDGISFVNIKPLNVTYKDVVEQLQELNADYQVLKGRNIYIGNYKDFYPNRDLGGFIQSIDKDFETSYNEEYTLQSFHYRYNEYEQDKDEKGTIEAVHTESEWMLPNKQVEGVKEVVVPFTRDFYRMESVRRDNFTSKRTTSTSNDDKFFIFECVELPENSRRTLQNVLDVNISNNEDENTTTIKLLSKDNFAWDLLGFQVGDTVYLYLSVGTYNIPAIYEVAALEPTLLTLVSNVYSSDTVAGQYVVGVTLDYPLTNVSFTNRTSEGFALIEGLTSKDQASNLAYTIRRNMKYWESFIRTASYYHQASGVLKNTYWKSNGDLVTRLTSEINDVKENETVKINTLETPLLTPRLYKTTIIADFHKVLELIDKLNEINEDNTIGGFIRVEVDRGKIVKGYIKELDYTWATQQLQLVIEEKHEDDFVTIYKKPKTGKTKGFESYKTYFINEVGYDLDMVFPLHYKATGNFLQLFDNSGIPLINPTHYSKFKVATKFNSTAFNTFTNIEDLCKAIDEL